MKLFEIAPQRVDPVAQAQQVATARTTAKKTPKFQYSLDFGGYKPTGFDNYSNDPLEQLYKNPVFRKHVNESLVDNVGSDQFEVCLMVDPGSEQQIAQLLASVSGTDIEFMSEVEVDPSTSPDEANMLVFARFDLQDAAGEDASDEASYQRDLALGRAERM